MAGKTGKSEENIVISKAEMKKLIKKGEETGVLTFAEINDAISDDLKSFDQIDDIVVQFKEMGIELVDGEADKGEEEESPGCQKIKSRQGQRKRRRRRG